MAQRLVAVGNTSSSAARLTSTEHPQDDCDIPAYSITHTGGSDDDYIKIPDCSGSQYYAEHHILIQANDGTWTVSIWDNDDLNHCLYWNTADAYSENNPIPATEGWQSVSILIEFSGGIPVVYASPWE